MDEAYIGAVVLFGGNFAPRNWALCQGQLLSISANTALFSILGTTFGGNGTTTFGLPDLRGRAAVGAGQGPGLSNYTIGEMTGTETVTLTVNQMPSHNHTVAPQAKNGAGDDTNPGGTKYMATASTDLYANSPNVAMGPSTSSLTGGNQPVSIIQPVLCINYIICVSGIFPSRN